MQSDYLESGPTVEPRALADTRRVVARNESGRLFELEDPLGALNIHLWSLFLTLAPRLGRSDGAGPVDRERPQWEDPERSNGNGRWTAWEARREVDAWRSA
jgi:hypothetical protein